MSDALNEVYEGIDREYSAESASTRRRFVGAAGAAIGGMGLLALPTEAFAKNDAPTILAIAATAEVLATIVNTVGPEEVDLDNTTKRNVQAAARQELIHYDVLKSLGAKELTKKIWVPDEVFASKKNLLNTLVAGDQIFINAYMIGTTAFADAKMSTEARYTAEFMGVEAVHRALALQSLGKLGNDRAFMKYSFTKIENAAAQLEKAGFGFGKQGSKDGKFYAFDSVRKRTPDPSGVNTRKPR